MEAQARETSMAQLQGTSAILFDIFGGVETVPSSQGSQYRVVLDRVYLNGLHTLKRLEIRNVSDFDIRVKFSSSLPGEQMAFQLSNENLPETTLPPAHPKAITLSNGSKSPPEHSLELKSKSSFDDVTHWEHHVIQPHQYNELFNLVSRVSEMDLQAHTSRYLVLLFLPDPNLRRHLSNFYSNTYQSSHVTGDLMFQADNSHNLDILSNHQTQSFSVQFSATVCASVLWCDISESGIDFGDCYLNETYFKDFILCNKSDVELLWSLSIPPSIRNNLNILDSHSGLPVDTYKIPSFGTRPLRALFRPSSIGTFVDEIQFENLNDNDNYIAVSVNAAVSARSDYNSLTVVSGSLDFGDCYTGQWVSRQLVLKNSSTDYMDVHLKSNDANVRFYSKLGQKKLREGVSLISSLYSSLDHLERRSDFSRSKHSLHSVTTSRATSPSNYTANDDNSVSSLDPLSDTWLLDAESIVDSERLTDSPIVNDEDLIQIDEISLRPGLEHVIEVFYLSDNDETLSEESLGKLVKRNFGFTITYDFVCMNYKEKVVKCKARVCASHIFVYPKQVDFGDTDVGTLKSSLLKIENRSELPAHVALRFKSKVLNCYKGEIIIPPNQFTEVKMDIYPRKVNADYRKQVTVANLNNRDNDLIVDVCANNVDKNRVTFHSLFYRTLTATSTNFIDFGVAVLNSPTTRHLTIDNITKKPLTLEMTSSLPDELQIYTVDMGASKPKSHTAHSKERKEKLLEGMDKTKPEHSVIPDAGAFSSVADSTQQTGLPNGGDNAYLDLATSAKISSKTRPKITKINSKLETLASSEMNTPNIAHTDAMKHDEVERTLPEPSDSFESLNRSESRSLLSSQTKNSELDNVKVHGKDLLALVDLASKANLLVTKNMSEDKVVRTQIGIRRDLDTAIKERWLVPISSVTILAESSLMFVLILTPSAKNRPYIQGKPKKSDAKIFIRLIDFDRDIHAHSAEFQSLLRADLHMIPVRELLIQLSLCRLTMELGQKNCNFGLVVKREKRSKCIIIYNRSETPLLYILRKSGSIASNDIFFGEGRIGIIRGFGKREVEFVFCPSMPGEYNEKIIVENVLDPAAVLHVSVKAQVRKPSNFFIKSLALDFGPIMSGGLQETSKRAIVITNTSKNTRTFALKFEVFPNSKYLPAKAIFEVPPDPVFADKHTDDAEEQIETYEQKLKIADRKGQDAKVKKINAKLLALKTARDAHLSSHRSSVVSSKKFDVVAKDNESLLVTGENFIVCSIEAKSSRTVSVTLAVSADAQNHGPEAASFESSISVFEHKNSDMTKIVAVKAQVYFNQASLVAALRNFTIGDDDALFSGPASTAISRATSLLYTIASGAQSANQNTFVLEPAFLDVGRVENNRLCTLYFKIRNLTSNQTLRLGVYPDPFTAQFIKIAGEDQARDVQPGAILRVDFTFQSDVAGQKDCCIVVYDHIHDFMLNFSFTIKILQGRYLEFFDLSDERLLLDLGSWFVDSTNRFSKVVPFRVKNVSSESLVLTAQSNLLQQLYIFLDPDCTIAVIDVDIENGQTITMHIAAQPNWTNSVANSQGISECRPFVGGMKFIIKSIGAIGDLLNPIHCLTSVTVKVVALIGLATIQLSSDIIDMGTVAVSGEAKRVRLFVYNRSSHLPATLTLKGLTHFVFEPNTLTLKGAVSDKSASTGFFDMEYLTGNAGLLEEIAQVCDFHTGVSYNSVLLRVFVDPLFILLQSSDGSELINSNLYLGTYNVFEAKDGCGSLEVVPSDQRSTSFQVSNLLEKYIDIEFKSSLNISVAVDGSQDRTEITTLPMGSRKTFTVSLLKPDFTSESCKAILSGITIVDTGTLSLYDATTQMCLSHLNVTFATSLSTGHVEPSVVVAEMSKIGVAYESAPFTFRIYNDSDVPLRYCHLDNGASLKIASMLQFSGPQNEENKSVVLSQTDANVVPAYAFHEVVGCVMANATAEIDHGTKFLIFNISNLCNPSNNMHLTVKVDVSLFPLKFDRLVDGCVVLPPLYYPQPLNATSCDVWFSIENVSDADLRFEIGLEELDQVSEFVKFEVISRFSNSVLKGYVFLASQGTLEVKVRASIVTSSADPSHRLSNELADISGILFGKIRLTTKNADNSSGMVEYLPLRGTLQEGPTFVIVTPELHLHRSKKGLSDDDSDGEENTFDNSRPTSVVQRLHDILEIKNLTGTFPVTVQIIEDTPSELSMKLLRISPLSENNTITIMPRESVSLRVEFDLSYGEKTTLADHIKLQIVDINSSTQQSMACTINMHP